MTTQTRFEGIEFGAVANFIVVILQFVLGGQTVRFTGRRFDITGLFASGSHCGRAEDERVSKELHDDEWILFCLVDVLVVDVALVVVVVVSCTLDAA
jgi:hypothetical protein